MIGQDFGFGAQAHANDQIILLPTRRDACYDMGAKTSWTMGYNNDENVFNKNGKQTEAIMRMIEQLKKPKGAKYDLT